jgi:2-iminobutanoate/2-iminopropanoate deaminase
MCSRVVNPMLLSADGAPVRAAVAAATLLLFATTGSGCAPARTRPPDVAYSKAAPDLPFSPVVRVGAMLYLSGQIGNAPGDHTAVVPGGIEPETRQAMENIKAALGESGASMDNVVKCTVMLSDMRDWAAMNAVYSSYFPQQKPARSSFGTTGRALGAHVEVECVAVAPVP